MKVFLIFAIVFYALSCSKNSQIEEAINEGSSFNSDGNIIMEQTLYRFQINGIWYTRCDIPADDCSVLPFSPDGIDAIRSWTNNTEETPIKKGSDVSDLICYKYRLKVVEGLFDGSLKVVESNILDNNPIFVIELNDKQKKDLESSPITAVKFVR